MGVCNYNVLLCFGQLSEELDYLKSFFLSLQEETLYEEFKYKFKIILTGGLAHLFKSNLKYNSFIDKELTLNGLIKII